MLSVPPHFEARAFGSGEAGKSDRKATVTTKTDILAFSENVIAFRPMFARIAGGVTNGLFLSQLFYWTGKGIRADGWIWKSYAEWEDETCLTRSEIDRARRDLKELGLIEELLRGIPATLHYRLCLERLGEMIEQDSEQRRLRDGANQIAESCNLDAESDNPVCRILQSNTETTPQTTPNRNDEYIVPDAPNGAPATPTAFSGWVDLLRNGRNRNATLRRMYETLYPDHDPPEYSYLGRIARSVGGASRLAQLMWENAARPPVGDVLAYLLAIVKREKAQAVNEPAGYAGIRAYLEKEGLDGDEEGSGSGNGSAGRLLPAVSTDGRHG